MDVRLVPGVSNDDAGALGRAGVATVADLRAASPAAVAAATGWPEERAASLVAAAKDLHILTDLPDLAEDDARQLLSAGVVDPETLAARDADEIARDAEIDAARIRRWQAAAQVAPTAEPVDASVAAPQWTPPAPPEKVVLKGAGASVLVEGAWRAAAIVTARAAADVDAALAAAPSDVVVLVAGADEAVVRFAGEAYESVPLYKERIARAVDGSGDEVEEVRVRVEEIREKRSALPPAANGDAKGLLGRLFGKR